MSTGLPKWLAATFIFLFLIVSVSHAANQTPPQKQPEVQAPKDPVKLSAGGLVSAGQNVTGSITVDRMSGGSLLPLSIYVPEGPNGIMPFIQPVYSSSGGNGPLGWGWSLELGSIVRSTKKGTPSYSNDDSFAATLAGQSMDLVHISGQEYRPKVDDRSLVFYREGEGWLAVDRSGTRYSFGTTEQSRVGFFRYRLEKVQDVFGNVLVINYSPWGDFEARYGLKQNATDIANPSNFAYVVKGEVERANRPDVTVDYKPGFGLVESRRLASITVTGGGNLLRRYDFAYTQSETSGRSLLSKVTETGADGHTSQTLVNLWYGLKGALKTENMSPSTLAVNVAADFNGDGRTDLAGVDPARGVYNVALSQDLGFSQETQWILGFAVNQSYLLGDFNGDGRTDLGAYDQAAHSFRVALSDGTRFVDKGVWLSGIPESALVMTGEANGDGLTDLIIFSPEGEGHRLHYGHSRGGKFELKTQPVALFQGLRGLVLTADVNADGLSDAVGFNPGAGLWVVVLNNGSTLNVERMTVHDFGMNRAPVLGDFNGDRQMDLAYYDVERKKLIYRPFNGNGFSEPQSCDLNISISSPQINVVDINGDGASDLFVTNANAERQLFLSVGPAPDMLTSLNNGFGGQVSIQYGSSAQLKNKYLPGAMPVVKSLTVANSLGDEYVTSYSYTGGFWDPVTREFFGFREVKSSDQLGGSTTVRFNQESLFLRGMIDETVTSGSDGRVYETTRNQWMAEPVIAGRDDVRFAGIKRTDTIRYDSPQVGLRTAVETKYRADLGVVTETLDYGEVDFGTGADTGSDLIRTVITYSPLSPERMSLRGVPVSQAVFAADGRTLAQEWYFYDGSKDGKALPSKGLLTRKEVWNKTGSQESRIVTEYSYGQRGAMLSTKDDSGSVNIFTYDPEYGIFQLAEKNAAGQEVTSEYYGVNNVPLDGNPWGCLKAASDPNKKRSVSTYDALGRTLTVSQPLDQPGKPTTVYEYVNYLTHKLVISRERVTYSGDKTYDTYTFVDGLGRTVAVKEPLGNGQTLVTGHVSYDKRGLVEKSYLPYSSAKPPTQLELPDLTRPAAVSVRDGLGRVVKQTAPDGKYATTSYSNSTVENIDANGHKERSTFNSRGRLILRQSYSGADGRHALYPSQPFQVYSQTSFLYDHAGRLISSTGPKGESTAMTYDALGRKLSLRDPDAGLLSYAYNSRGQLTSSTDGRSLRHTMAYDNLGRLTSRMAGGSTAAYSYDGPAANMTGRLSGVSYNAAESTFFRYDAMGRETSSTKVLNGKAFAVSRQYDAMGRAVSVTYPDDRKVSYEFEASGKIASVAIDLAGQTAAVVKSVSYAASGQPARIEYGNGVTVEYRYDPLSLRLTELKATGPSGVIQHVTYAFDGTGNVVESSDRVRNKKRTYRYDALNRLVRYEENGAAVSYEYDQAGNIIKKGNLVYTYGERGAGPHAVTSISDGTRMSYDAGGNMIVYQTAAKTFYYAYNERNQLIQVEAQPRGSSRRSLVARYTYDGDGGRTSKTVFRSVTGWKMGRPLSSAAQQAVTTRYVGSLAEETAGRVTDFVFLDSMRVAAATGTTLRYFLTDHLGSVNVVLDGNGQVIERTDFGPWGEVTGHEKYENTADAAWFYFTGKKLDEETGLYYFGSRYYNPKLGRFITPDTIVQDPSNPQTLNRYTYCNNNPVNLVDPTGHSWSWKRFWNSVIGAVAGVVLGVVLGPAGMGLAAWIAGAIGGAAGGATTAALSGAGSRGIWTAAGMGAAFGAVAGWSTTLPKGLGNGLKNGLGIYGLATTARSGAWDGLAGGYFGANIATGGMDYALTGKLSLKLQPGTKKIFDSDRWTCLGILTTDAKAAAYVRAHNTAVLYTPSRGFIADMTRASLQKIFGNSVASKQMGGYLSDPRANGHTIIAHSEGTLTLAGGMKTAANSGVNMDNTTFSFNAPGITETTANQLASSLGQNRVEYYLNPADPIGFVATWNPITAPVYGILGVATLTTFHDTRFYASSMY